MRAAPLLRGATLPWVLVLSITSHWQWVQEALCVCAFETLTQPLKCLSLKLTHP